MSDPSQPLPTPPVAPAFPSAAPPTEGAFPLPPPPAFPTAPPPFDAGPAPAPGVVYSYPSPYPYPYPYLGQGYLTPTQDALVAQTSGLAIASLVCSLSSLAAIVFGPLIILCIPGIICGHIALWRIDRSHGQLKGKGLAIAGLIVGYIILALLLLGVAALVLLFRSYSSSGG